MPLRRRGLKKRGRGVPTRIVPPFCPNILKFCRKNCIFALPHPNPLHFRHGQMCEILRNSAKKKKRKICRFCAKFCTSSAFFHFRGTRMSRKAQIFALFERVYSGKNMGGYRVCAHAHHRLRGSKAGHCCAARALKIPSSKRKTASGPLKPVSQAPGDLVRWQLLFWNLHTAPEGARRGSGRATLQVFGHSSVGHRGTAMLTAQQLGGSADLVVLSHFTQWQTPGMRKGGGSRNPPKIGPSHSRSDQATPE